MHLAILGWFTSLGNLYIEAPSKNENPAFPNEEMVFFFSRDGSCFTLLSGAKS